MKKSKSKEKSEKYWIDRIQANQKRADKFVDTYSKRLNKLYAKSYRKIERYLDSLLVEIKEGELPSRTELYRYNKYLALMDKIEKEAKIIGDNQLSGTKETIDKAFKLRVGVSRENYNSTTNFNNQTKYILNENWSGESYSKRIWTNTNAFAQEVKNEITNQIVLGKNPDQIKKSIMKKYTVSYHVADRLVRTETSYAFNQSTIQQYRDEGVQKVKILVEPDACDDCLSFDDKEIPIQDAPVIPIHPNCRCCYIPVVTTLGDADTSTN
jgi:SPP1 gp7 family putative phage head morphogenesis protein